MSIDSDWTVDRHGGVRWQGILAHPYVASGFARRATPDSPVCMDCWEDVSCPVHRRPPPAEEITAPQETR